MAQIAHTELQSKQLSESSNLEEIKLLISSLNSANTLNKAEIGAIDQQLKTVITQLSSLQKQVDTSQHKSALTD